MPSVGMRRTTRVFGVVKGVDGARVLRSGRRLFPGSGDGKFRRANDGDQWLHTMIKSTHTSNKNHHNNSSVKCKENGWTHHSKLKQGSPGVAAVVHKRVKSENLHDDAESRKFGVVYTRKRRRLDGEKLGTLDNKKYGIQFSRRQRRKQGDVELPIIVVSVDSSSTVGLASFLLLVFGYMRKGNVRLSALASFLSAEPVRDAFASSGIRFLQESTNGRTGVCKFFAVRCTVPIFSLDFSAVPSCFVNMHLRSFLRVKCLSTVPVHTSLDEDSCDEVSSESEEERSGVDVKVDALPEIVNKLVMHPSVRASKLAFRHGQYRNGLNSRGIQKRRSSLRRKKSRNPSLVGVHKANGALVSDLVSSRKNGIPFSSVVSKNKLRSSVRSSPASNLKVASPTVVEETRSIDTSSCSSNVLVIESDRCYRIEGATITLEVSDSKDWVVAAKKDGLTRYTHTAQKGMRPCSFNRITHDILWTGDEGWKLEFTNRQDWLIFKDIYKECSDRNVPAPISKVIPVPGVREVLGYENSNSRPFSRPDAYISVSNDEVARALAKRTAIYDLDSEDEEWLRKFNNDFFGETEHQEHLSEDNFELTIDAFEKAFYCSPDELTDEKAAVNLCIELGRREVVEAVYSYWMKKWKQRRSTLLRVFQLHQAKKAALIAKPVLRKRRSFNRQASQFGRGKQPRLLQAMAAEHDALEEQNAMHKVEAAKTSAKRSVEVAILRRQHAQRLMENADLAIYRATMALRIAEAARLGNSTDAAVTHFFD